MTNNPKEELVLIYSIELFHKICNKLNKDVSNFPVHFSFRSRMTRAVGKAGWDWNNQASIRLSRELFFHLTKEAQENTIAHEIVHILAPRGSGHNNDWKELMIDAGYKPERCVQSNEIENFEAFQSARTSRKSQVRYVANCLCGEHLISGRKRANILSGASYSCLQCRTFLELEI